MKENNRKGSAKKSPLLKDLDSFCSVAYTYMRVYMVYAGDFTWPLFCYYFPSFPAKSVGVLWKTVAHLAVKAPVRISQKPRKKLDA